MARYVVARVGEIAPGSRKVVQVDGRGIIVFNVKDEFYALSETCPHRGGLGTKHPAVERAGSGWPAAGSAAGTQETLI